MVYKINKNNIEMSSHGPPPTKKMRQQSLVTVFSKKVPGKKYSFNNIKLLCIVVTSHCPFHILTFMSYYVLFIICRPSCVLSEGEMKKNSVLIFYFCFLFKWHT